MKIASVVAWGVVILSSVAVAEAVQNDRVLTPEKKAALVEARRRHTGGIVEFPGMGNVCVLNDQKSVGLDKVAACVEKFRQAARGVKVTVVDASFSLSTAEATRAAHGAAGLYIIEDSQLPLSLLSLEEGWGMMNVGKLKEDDPDAAKLEARFRKEFVRISSLVYSGARSQFKNTPLQTVRSAKDLDGVVGEEYGMDVVTSLVSNLAELGVKPSSFMTYRAACQRGVAPMPTNDVQRAIWEEVRAVPTKPMKIEFDPKTDK